MARIRVTNGDEKKTVVKNLEKLHRVRALILAQNLAYWLLDRLIFPFNPPSRIRSIEVRWTSRLSHDM